MTTPFTAKTLEEALTAKLMLNFGKTPEEAKRILEEAKLVCTVSQDYYYYEGVQEGHVGAMSVLPDTRVDKGSTVIVYLCKEPEQTEPTTNPNETPTESSSSEVPGA